MSTVDDFTNYDDWKTDPDYGKSKKKLDASKLEDVEVRYINMISECCYALPLDELCKNNNGWCSDCKEGSHFIEDKEGIWG